MFVITVEFKIKPEHIDGFMPLMLENAEASLTKEPGCHQFDVSVALDNPAKVFLYELYTDKAAFNAHKQTDHYKAFDKNTADLVAKKSGAHFVRTWPSN
jgi:quinol monooxygenase YgiN